MNAATGRRAALVAALLGLLAFLGGATLPAAHTASTVGASTTAFGAEQATAPTPTVGDTARAVHPAAARTSAHDRSPAPYPGGWAVPALLLLLASAALAVGVLRACRRPLPQAWRRDLATRAPPAAAL